MVFFLFDLMYFPQHLLGPSILLQMRGENLKEKFLQLVTLRLRGTGRLSGTGNLTFAFLVREHE